jgi:hypothetical protein
MHPVETFLRDLHAIRATGVAVSETSFYAQLAELLNVVGRALKPAVRCHLTLANQGAGTVPGKGQHKRAPQGMGYVPWGAL